MHVRWFANQETHQALSALSRTRGSSKASAADGSELLSLPAGTCTEVASAFMNAARPTSGGPSSRDAVMESDGGMRWNDAAEEGGGEDEDDDDDDTAVEAEEEEEAEAEAEAEADESSKEAAMSQITW
jgi:hypothetical protein